MGIPKRPQREDEIAPPPPPPRFIREPPSFANHHGDYFQGSTSSYGSLGHIRKAHRPGYGRYGTSKTMRLITDEGYHSLEPSLPEQPQAKLLSHNQLYRLTAYNKTHLRSGMSDRRWGINGPWRVDQEVAVRTKWLGAVLEWRKFMRSDQKERCLAVELLPRDDLKSNGADSQSGRNLRGCSCLRGMIWRRHGKLCNWLQPLGRHRSVH
ncbi:hypothetical protein JX266_014219 [Neoarthrinium moseri]|nr:hypothetical protein JX266_014219 [Neoarthrinium moseri]